MRIGIYARGLSEKSGGAKKYINSIVLALISNVSKDDELYIFHNLGERHFEKDKNNKPNVFEVVLGSRSKLICDFVLAPFYINKLNLDIVVFSKNVVPFFINCTKIVVVLDLGYYLKDLNPYPFIDVFYMKRMIRSSVRRADMVISISEATKKEMRRILNVDENKIQVMHLACNESYRRIEDKSKLESIREKYDLKIPFIFYAGSISPRKNLKRLLKAFATLSGKIPHQLVITGIKGWNNAEELQLIDSMNQRVRLLGYLPEEEMPIMYNLADGLIYPSLYEGFGLPIIEAQACGCPVISSSVSSMAEVGGQSVLSIDPYCIDSIAQAILRLTSDKNLRKLLVNGGFDNVKRFSWKKSAERMLEIIKS